MTSENQFQSRRGSSISASFFGVRTSWRLPWNHRSYAVLTNLLRIAGGGPTNKLAARLNHALEWLAENASYFLLPEVLHGRDVNDTFQRLTELAVTLRILDDCKVFLEPQLTMLREPIAAAVIRRDFCSIALRTPVYLPLMAHLLAVTPKTPATEAIHEQLQTRIDHGYLTQDERVPHRTMDVVYAMEVAGLSHSLADWNSLCASSVLAHPLRLPLVDRSTAYALTHAIFFSTAFGCRPIDSLASVDVVQLASHVERLAICAGLERDWDLLGELLLSRECLRLRDSATSQLTWRMLIGAQQPSGCFGGPERLLAKQSQSPWSEAWNTFVRSYHTTLVCVMAMALKLRNGAEGGDSPGGLSNATRSILSSQKAAAQIDLVDLQDSARRAQLWFARVSHQENALSRPSRQRLLLGSWICDEILAYNNNTRSPQVTRALAAALADETEDTGHAEEGPLELLALIVSISHGVAIIGGAELARAITELDASRRVYVSSDLLENGCRVSIADTRAFISEILQASATGLLDVDLGRRAVALTHWMDGYVVQCLRDYQLLHAAEALRALNYVGAARLVGHDALEYVLFQQTPAGDFGLTAPEEMEIAPLIGEEGAVEAFKLPTTLECLWALAELLIPWRLSRSILRLSRNLVDGDPPL